MIPANKDTAETTMNIDVTPSETERLAQALASAEQDVENKRIRPIREFLKDFKHGKNIRAAEK